MRNASVTISIVIKAFGWQKNYDDAQGDEYF